jgi:hypothetical protein
LTEKSKCNGRVFAFLPTECDSGLPFLINADFLLTASREALLVDRPWNLWLRNCIAPTFVGTFKMLLKYPEWRKQAYSFIPIQSDMNLQMADFFQPSVETIHKTLREEECILTVKDSFVRPRESWLATKIERALLGQPDAPPELARYLFVDPDLESWRTRLKPLGVQDFTTHDLLKVVNNRTWLELRDEAWWESAFTLFAERKVKAADVNEIPLIRCADGVCRLPNPSEIFLVNDTLSQLPALPSNGPLIHLISASLQQRLQNNPLAWNWLTQVLGLRQFSLRNYIMDRLLPWMSVQNGECAAQKLITTTRFIAANLECLAISDQKNLAEQLPWVIENGNIVTSEERNGRELVMPETLQGPDGWNWVFIGPADREHFLLVSDLYVGDTSPDTRKLVKEFFEACRITAFPDPAVCEPSQGGEVYNQALARCANEVTGTPDLRECISPRWLRDLTSVAETQNGVQKVTALERLLKQFGVEHTVSFLNLAFKRPSYHAWQRLSADSEFGGVLKNKPWLKTTKEYQRPVDTFVDIPEIREFLGESVAYVNTSIAPAVLEILGVHVRLTPDVLINLLRQMRDSGNVDFALVVRIYRRLHDLSFNIKYFKTEKLIYLSEPKANWFELRDLVWKDVGPVFDDHFGYLDLTYANHDLHNFFTSKLEVPEEPEARQFAEVWAQLSASLNPVRDTTEKRLRRIVERLIFEKDKLSEQGWWSEIRSHLKIWTTAEVFAAPAEVFVPDDGHAAELFSKLVSIAWLPTQAHQAIPFLLTLGCHSLASALHVDISQQDNSVPVDISTVLTPESKELIVLMFCNGTKWEERTGHLEVLLKTGEHLIKELTAEYSLINAAAPIVVPEARDAFWHYQKVRLLKKEGVDQDSWRSSAAESLAALFSGAAQRRELTDKIYRLLAASPATARKISLERSWSFSIDQQKWLDKCQWQLVISNRQKVEEEPKRTITPRKEPVKPETKEVAKGNTTVTPEPKSELPKIAPEAPKTPSSAVAPAPTASSPVAQTPSAVAQPAGAVGQTSSATQPDTLSPPAITPVLVKKPGAQRSRMIEGKARHRRQRREAGPVEKLEQLKSTNLEETKSGLESVSQTDKKEIEQQGRAHAIIELKHLGYDVTEMSYNNPGYDLVAKKTGELLWIEIKAHLRSASKVFVTKREWKEYNHALKSNGAKWELWNIEFLAEDESCEVQITRYSTIPLDAIEQSGIWVDLTRCSFSSETSL